MPQIIVIANESDNTERDDTPVMMRERVNIADFESDHFAGQLVERIGWAVSDAHEVERSVPADEDAREPSRA